MQSRSGILPADVLRRSEQRQAEAQRVVERLNLFRRWSEYGRPVLVGAVAYGLAVAPANLATTSLTHIGSWIGEK